MLSVKLALQMKSNGRSALQRRTRIFIQAVQEMREIFCCRILSEIFGLYHGDSTEPANMKDAILLDLYFYTIQFCIDHGFSREQLSAFFSIIRRTHNVCIETPFGNLEQAFRYFRDMLLCHSVKVRDKIIITCLTEGTHQMNVHFCRGRHLA